MRPLSFYLRNLCSLVALWVVSASVSDARIFTDQTGRTFEGELIASTATTVQIRRLSDQQVFSLPLNTLSPQDQVFIAQSKPAESEAPSPPRPNYRLGRFTITTADAKAEELQLRLKYNNRDLWKGSATSGSVIDLPISVDTNFNEEPKKGYARSGSIYLYIESKNYATQSHVLKKTGGKLSLQTTEPIKLHRKKYVIIEYAFYPGDEPDFTGREPLHSGVAAVGHWGALPGFGPDWKVWQGTAQTGHWGDTLLLDFHRGASENGFIKAAASHFGQMQTAPRSGYIHHGACGAPKLVAKAGSFYYCRVVGHTESMRGYGKLHIKEITGTVPEGMTALTR